MTPAMPRSLFSRRCCTARKEYGGKKIALHDADDRKLTYDDIVRAAFALGHALKKGTKRGEAIGVMLPTGAGAVITFFALNAYGRVPAMLNFTAGARNIEGGAEGRQGQAHRHGPCLHREGRTAAAGRRSEGRRRFHLP